MIVRQEGERLVIVRQADHAELSGSLAAAWGQAPWERPRPYPAVTVGARLHDDAWLVFDEAPEVRDGRPLSFNEVDRVRTSSMYAAGVSAITAIDPYAGLLVSLHYSGFFTSHWGWQPFATPDRFPGAQGMALRAFVEEERNRQEVLRRQLPPSDADEALLEANYKWLQLWDRISLDICRQSREEPWVMDYAPVPACYAGGDTVALKVAMVAPGRYTLNPYPLLVTPFRTSIPAVSMDLSYASREAFLAAWAVAPQERLPVVIEGGEGP
ncbi:MAG: DUF3891 family protein [Candidatus Dormibacteria bacterium]